MRTFPRIFGAQEELTGQAIGTLTVTGVASVRPVLTYSAKCKECGASTVYTHSELLLGGRCKNSACAMQMQRRELERQDRELRQAVRASRGW
jgi:hypothetical protein